MLVRQWNILVELLVSHTATQNLMCDQREGSLRKLGVEETAEDSRFKVVNSICTPEENLQALFPPLIFFLVQCLNSWVALFLFYFLLFTSIFSVGMRKWHKLIFLVSFKYLFSKMMFFWNLVDVIFFKLISPFLFVVWRLYFGTYLMFSSLEFCGRANQER